MSADAGVSTRFMGKGSDDFAFLRDGIRLHGKAKSPLSLPMKRFNAVASSEVYAFHASAPLRSIAGGTAARELNTLNSSSSSMMPRGLEHQITDRCRALLRRPRR